MADDLLVSLRKYIPREGKNPIENFVTEAFSWILKNNDSLAKLIIKKMLGHEVEIKGDIRCSTQVNFSGVYPDMLIEFDNKVIISEHKVWAELHDNQIENYRRHAEENFDDFKIILITATPAQHSSKATDVDLCWSDIYEVIKSWNATSEDSSSDTIVPSFLRLLRDEGLGPAEPIKFASIRNYNYVKNLPYEVKDLLTFIENKYGERLDKIITEESRRQDAWGRYGFSFLAHWNPGLFIGFLLDEKDHRVEPIAGMSSPDFSLIVDFDKRYHSGYPKDETYLEFKKELKSIIDSTTYEWDMYDIANHGKGQNIWHPIHIRVPMSELFKGAEDIEMQTQRFFDYIEDLIPPILKLDTFKSMRSDVFTY